MTEFDLNALMQQAAQLQEQMSAMQKDLEKLEVEGSAGAGMVKVKATGAMKVISVEIDDSVMGEDKDMLQDLVIAAVNNALEKAREAAGGQMQSMLPPGVMPPGGLPGMG